MVKSSNQIIKSSGLNTPSAGGADAGSAGVPPVVVLVLVELMLVLLVLVVPLVQVALVLEVLVLVDMMKQAGLRPLLDLSAASPH